MTALPLRPYQAVAIEQARQAFRQGARAPLLVAPTGAGKTRLGVEIALSAISKSTSGIVYWFAHTRELLTQACKALIRDGVPPELLGVISSSHRYSRDARIQVCSIQSVVKLLARGAQLPQALLCILDEAHHYVADEWGSAVRDISTERTVRIGLTATPERGDGRPLGDMFDRLISVSSVEELTNLGVLVPAKILTPESAGDLAADPVDAWRAHAEGEQTFVFCPSVPHAEAICERFRSWYIPAAVIHSETKQALREVLIAGFSSQDKTLFNALGGQGDPPRVLCNVRTLTEGVDVPAASCAILACRDGHAGQYIQKVGRVLRAADLKTHATIIDLCGNALPPPAGHGLPNAHREYSLQGQAIRCAGKPEKDTVSTCKTCGCVVERWRVNAANQRVCPHCGDVGREIKPLELDERPLRELGTIASHEAKVAAYRQLVAIARARGYKLDEHTPFEVRPGFPSMRYRELFGAFPLPSVVAACGL